jgi:hypothetical protein
MTFAMRDRVQEENKHGLLGLQRLIYLQVIFFVNKSIL